MTASASSPESAKPSRRLYWLWATALVLLTVAGLVSWIAVPLYRTHQLVNALERHEVYVEDVVRRLGGPDVAAGRAGAYLNLPAWMNPNRQYAVYVAASCGRKGLPALIRALEYPDVSATAAGALARLGPEAAPATPALVRLLSHQRPHVRAQAIKTLSAIGDIPDPARPTIEALLKDPDRDVRLAAAETLATRGSAEAMKAMSGMLTGGDEYTREGAAIALGDMGARAGSAAPALEKALGDKSKSVRIFAAEALWRVTGKPQKAVLTLTHVLAQGDIRERSLAAAALGRMKGEAKAALPALVKALDDRYEGVRRDAASALGSMGAPAAGAVPALEKKLEDSDDWVRVVTAAAIFKLSPKRREAMLDLLIHRLRTEGEPNLRAETADQIGQLGPAAARAVPALAAALKSEYPTVRSWSAVSLGRMGAAALDAVPHLEDALKDPESGHVSKDVREALQKIRTAHEGNRK